MLKIPGFGGLKKIYWKDIEPGEIILAGVNVNNGLPLELANFPSLTVTLIYELNQKYHFRPNKEVLVAFPTKGESHTKMAKGFLELDQKVKKFNELRLIYLREKIQILNKYKKPLNENFRFLSSEFINNDLHYISRLNSNKSLTSKNLPCFLQKLKTILSPSDIITGKINKKLNLPDDKGINLFLGIAYSQNFKSELLKYFSDTIDIFYDYIDILFTKTKINLLGVSEKSDQIKHPIGGREMENGEIHYSSFFKKCLRYKNKELINKAILLTANSPFDLAESMEVGEKIKKNEIDLTIIYINPNLNDDEKKKMAHVCEATNCNLYIINSPDFLLSITLEAFENYLGNLTYSLKPPEIPFFQEFTTKPINQKKEEILRKLEELEKEEKEEKKEKVIKPFEFKRIKRSDLQ